MIEQELERLLGDARKDKSLKAALAATRNTENPVEDFCAFARDRGYDITAGELFTMGLTANDAKLRSVNGGGVNPIDGWDDELLEIRQYSCGVLTTFCHKSSALLHDIELLEIPYRKKGEAGKIQALLFQS